tara:strand:- start:32 stop:1330 length:1299 start_codon:yes stop_codon:yes gene_type:complete
MNNVSVVDDANNNSSLDYGEQATFYASFQNVGQDPSGELTFDLFHEGNMVEILTEEIITESVDPNEEITVGPFEVSVNWNIENGVEIPFVIQVTSGYDSWEYSTTVNGLSPEYQLLSSEFLNNLNGTLDPGETSAMEIVMRNIGSSPVSYPTFDVTTSDLYLNILGVSSNNAYWWDINEDVIVTIEISASNDAPVGHSSVSGVLIGSLNTPYSEVISLPITLGLMIEDFETGDFSALSWEHDGDADWVISSESHSGNFSAKSGSISHNQTSDLSINMNVLYEGELEFAAMASSEIGGSGTVYDFLEFYINGESQDLVIGGNSNWTEYSVLLPPGVHTLSWVYQKDNASSAGDDCVWIDRVVFPPGTVSPLNIDFGDINLDNIVNILDVIVTLNHLIGHIDLSTMQFQNADMNLDGNINILDILIIVDLVLED